MIHRVSILSHTIILKKKNISIYFALDSISLLEGKPNAWVAWRNV